MSATTTSLLRNTDNEVIPQYWGGTAWVPYKNMSAEKLLDLEGSPVFDNTEGSSKYIGSTGVVASNQVVPFHVADKREKFIYIANNLDVKIDVVDVRFSSTGGTGDFGLSMYSETDLLPGQTLILSSKEIPLLGSPITFFCVRLSKNASSIGTIDVKVFAGN